MAFEGADQGPVADMPEAANGVRDGGDLGGQLQVSGVQMFQQFFRRRLVLGDQVAVTLAVTGEKERVQNRITLGFEFPR